MTSNVQPITRARHKALQWTRHGGYSFAARSSFVVLSAAEVPKAALAMPLAFAPQDGGWVLGAMLGPTPQNNLFVDTDGRWTGTYIPAAFRAHPFCIGWNEASEPLLCVDEGSGLVVEEGGDEDFFDEAEDLSSSLKQVWSFLAERNAGEATLFRACGALHAADLMEPWSISIKDESGTREITGLYRISEPAIMTLSDSAVSDLLRQGVLGLAYAQILSMGNLERLGQLAQARAQAEAAERARAEIKPMIMLPEDNTIDWDWSKIGR